MSQQEPNYNQSTFSQENAVNPMDLLFDEEWLRKAVVAEDKVGGNIGAGLDWGSGFGDLMLNLELLGRLTTLRISLNREVRLLLNNWNLGTATKIAVKTARERLLQRLRLPTPEVREHILVVLGTDELYSQEFISSREILRELLGVLLKQEDWETIAAVAADSLKEQIMHQVSVEKISA
ncbi:hypothetical protein DP113_33070 (plasmid) [Brasilonema octagenarum UFV-E1]|uniref:Uncharacterized protein n=2 Tax=Brasilonema TaxID=383614 RepID=A0A856MR02_9CYAN|nr:MULTISPECIES: hypothetical protein [Brasilonema]NMF65737.1 hypothetical protein [Brasilonema octagenarum UFV-OR1]QDL12580.1 hypothetical protein DP114_32970 [Brasilonema sennae CENA114]QDL18974.1 hypothetical protein DP113_33070 [Brasilonema octagenarum UFV-E1]